MFITIENGIISGIYCGLKDEGNEIDVPDNFSGLVGQKVKSFYDDWTIKPLSVLLDEGIEKIPEGYKLENNQFIPMTEIEKMKEGITAIPDGYEIKGNELSEILTPEKQNLNDKQNIINRLSEIDTFTIRPLRATLAGTQSEADTVKLVELEVEAECLREQLRLM